MLISTQEIKIALNLSESAEVLLDIWNEAQDCVNTLNVPKDPRAYELLLYMRSRQKLRIYKNLNGEFFVHNENCVFAESKKWKALIVPYERLPAHQFERLLGGNVEFIYPSTHPENARRAFYHIPENHFLNWEEFPELHIYHVLATEDVNYAWSVPEGFFLHIEGRFSP